MDFTLLQWNINGILNNYQELQLLIKDMDPSFISLQETHCAFNFSPIPPKNYNSYFVNSIQNTTSKQGTGIFIKSNIPHKQIHINCDYQVVAIEVNLNKTFTVLSFYIPPCQDISIREISRIISLFTTPLLIVGDFNCWNTIWGSSNNNSRGILMETIIERAGLCLLNNGKPTHFSTHNTFSHIDLSFCSVDLLPLTSWDVFSDLHSSDHFPIQIVIKLSDGNSNPVKTNKFLIHLADWQNFSKRAELEIENRSITSSSNKNAATITKSIRVAANLYIPQCKQSNRPNRIPVPWWNPNLAELRRQKMLTWQQFKSNPIQENLILYKRQNAIFRKELKKAKTDSFKHFTNNINRNTPISEVWNKINKITRKSGSTIIKAINTQNETITDPMKIANHFGVEWANYSSDENFPALFNSAKNTANNITIRNTQDNIAGKLETPITIIELNSCLGKVKGTTPGLDRISYQMIKSLKSTSKIKLLEVYNTIFNSGVLPHSWKLAVVVPIPKNKNPSSVTSFRPISLLPCLSKIIERIIATRLAWYLERKKLIAKEQVAFKVNKGCDDALLHIDYYITNALSAKNHVTALSIDFEKAFDRIGSHVILNILKSWSVGPKIFNFVKSFLSNRRFKVRINGILSKSFPLRNGIPQGSPLSVVLFQIAFNEISKIIAGNRLVEHCLYADDLYIFCKKNQNMETTAILEELLQKIKNWTKYSGAKISLEKTKKLHICRKHNCDSDNYTIQTDGIAIENVKKLKALGVIFSHNYNWKYHLTQLKNSLLSRVNIIRYLSNKSFVHVNTLTYLTKTLVLAKIDYGLYLYGNSCKTNLKIITSTYHQAARACVYAFRTTPISNILAEAGLPSIEDRIYEIKSRYLTKLLYSTNSIIDKDITSVMNAKRPKRIKSAIAESLALANEFDIPLNISNKIIKKPPWIFKNTSIDMSLSNLKKNETPNTVFLNLLSEQKSKLKSEGWQFIYTDGTKSQGTLPAYAVVNNEGVNLILKTLHEHSSVFTAEACAIYHAVCFALAVKKKTIIFTDSLSVMKAIKNPFNFKWNTVIKIRDALIENENKVKIHWLPSHIGIAGNEKADIAAKYASRAPITMDETMEKIDIRRHIKSYVKLKLKEKQVNHFHYSNINIQNNPPRYPTDIDKEKIKIFSRLRLGHTSFSHEWILKKHATPPTCHVCNCTLTIKHILDECLSFQNHRNQQFGNNSAVELLKEPSIQNINQIYYFIKKTKLNV